MNLIAELRERNLLQDITPGTEEQLLKEMTRGYIGFDPTAESLHVGSLLPITLLMRLQRAGHKPYALVGGATGMIGDPSGKSQERNLLSVDTIRKNCDGIRSQLEKFLDFTNESQNCAVLVNNYDWFHEISFLDFIRDTGKHITVNYMLAKDSVSKRLETGMSFTEFTYQLIQGYDFYHLFATQNVCLQMGGADQWGNIVTGTELIRRKNGGDAFAFTCKLITKADGTKFGKSEGGNIWLDRKLTSPYAFYQFWMKLSDDDAARMALIFSFKPVEEIKNAIAEHLANSAARKLQRALAEEMTVMVHSEADLQFARDASELLFGKAPVEGLRALADEQLQVIMDGSGLPQAAAPKSSINDGVELISFLVTHGIFSSRGEARKMIQQGGVSINKEKITQIDFVITDNVLIRGKYLIIQRGKNHTIAVFQ